MDLQLTFSTSYLFAFAMGLFSSMHCIGMCGSIIGSLTFSLEPKIRENKRHLIPYILSYNIGRIFSYVVAGVIIGSVQYLFKLPFIDIDGYRILQLLSAVFMISAGFYIAGWFPKFAYIEKIGSKLWKFIEPFGRKLIPVKSKLQAFLFGTIWGWLPCGLVYTSLALAATAGDFAKSGLTMLAFGIGTLPAVMGVGIITNALSKISRMQKMKSLIGLFFIIIALLSAFPHMYPLRLQHF